MTVLRPDTLAKTTLEFREKATKVIRNLFIHASFIDFLNIWQDTNKVSDFLKCCWKCWWSSILLKLFHIKNAKISEFSLIIFIGIPVPWDDLVVSILPISFKTFYLVTLENVNIELFLYLPSTFKTPGWFRYFMIALKEGSWTSFVRG